MNTKNNSQDERFVDIDLSFSETNSKNKQQDQPDSGFQAPSGMIYTPPSWGPVASESTLNPIVNENKGSSTPTPDNRSAAY